MGTLIQSQPGRGSEGAICTGLKQELELGRSSHTTVDTSSGARGLEQEILGWGDSRDVKSLIWAIKA